MVEKEVILTLEGLRKLEEELEHSKTSKRQEIAKRIKEAIAFGDISENSEYDDAKNEQGFIEGRIITLEKMLRNARVIDEVEGTEFVALGAKVRLKDMDFGDEEDYFIVGSAEADPFTYKISNESPVGKAALGQTIGAIIEVDVPAGLLSYQIVNIM
ncbi:MAG TPA: transcription elongation factor GreA [Desulfosporosinus sp.]|nr:transcription elongation factor GreA [Desulfosporosinus sp.]